jgi:hypothetical protein
MNQFPQASQPKYPLGTVIAYGPDNKTATKLVASVFRKPSEREPADIHKWFVQGGDIRQDPTIAAEVAEFFKRHGVKQSTTYDRILGCPHEEGIDYPEGEVCPHCPFWANVDRFTHQPKRAPGEPKIGRNEPCPCGSGKKYKNCHGRGGA